MEHKAKISISRPTWSDGRKAIVISVEDDDAGIQFLELEMSLEDFAECVTGLHGCDANMKFRGLENVGKKQERDTIEFKMPDCSYKEQEKIAYEQAKLNTPEGWIASSYFGSEGSFFTKDGENWARTSIHRWVEKE